MSDKELALDLLKKLPADARLEDISKEIEFLAALRERDEQASATRGAARTGRKGIQIVDFK